MSCTPGAVGRLRKSWQASGGSMPDIIAGWINQRRRLLQSDMRRWTARCRYRTECVPSHQRLLPDASCVVMYTRGLLGRRVLEHVASNHAHPLTSCLRNTNAAHDHLAVFDDTRCVRCPFNPAQNTPLRLRSKSFPADRLSGLDKIELPCGRDTRRQKRGSSGS
ncbi:hypothetical protein BC629DRAFT_927081 [Irpex lacteus]|nr:hypothetical protein BC629DRAFT_927081 [Irpex lacteus]